MNIKYTFAFALLTSTILSQNVNATLNINDSVLVDGKYEITENVGIGGITEDITLHKTDTNPFPELTISGKVEGYTGKFTANWESYYKKYSTIIFKNWNSQQNFNIGGNGFFIFDKQTTPNEVIISSTTNIPHIFLNGNTFSKSSANQSMNLYLGNGVGTTDTGYNFTIEGYTNFDKVNLYAGGLRNNVSGDINTMVKNSVFANIHGGGQGADIDGDINLIVDNSQILAGKVIGNSTGVNDFIYQSGSNVSISYVTGDINITLKNNAVTKSLWGQYINAKGNEQVGLGGAININIENSAVNDDVRGSTGGSADMTWANQYLSTNDININVTDSRIGGEIVSVGSYGSAEDVTININGNTSIGYDENGNQTDFGSKLADGWIIAGTSRAGGTIQSTEVNLDTKGETNTIKLAGYVNAGSREKDGFFGTKGDSSYSESVLGDATLNMTGGGNIQASAFRSDHVKGKSTFNITNVKATATDVVTGFDEINIDEKSVLTAGEISLAQDSVVNVVLDNESTYSKIIADTLDVNGAKINLNINDEGVYNLLTYTTNVSDFTWNLEHALYNIIKENGTLTVMTKTSEQLAQESGASEEQADALVSIIKAKDNGNDKSKELAEALKDAMQKGNTAGALEGAKDAAPTTSYLVMGVAKENADTIAKTTFAHIDNLEISNRLWAQGIYNHAKQDMTSSNEGYSSDSTGLALGVDKDISENTTLGLGYAYIDTDAQSGNRDVDVKSHNIFIYGKYQPSKWYAKAILNYGMAEYEESKSAMNISLNGKYDVNYYSAQVMSGYEFDNGLTPEFGLRYLMVDADSYSDGAQNISVEKNDILTAALGTKYDKAINAQLPFKLKANARFALTYDLLADDNTSTTVVIGAGQYDTTSEKLERFGVEGGLGLTATVNNVDLSLEYNGAFRKDYNSNSAMFRLKYNF